MNSANVHDAEKCAGVQVTILRKPQLSAYVFLSFLRFSESRSVMSSFCNPMDCTVHGIL